MKRCVILFTIVILSVFTADRFVVQTHQTGNNIKTEYTSLSDGSFVHIGDGERTPLQQFQNYNSRTQTAQQLKFSVGNITATYFRTPKFSLKELCRTASVLPKIYERVYLFGNLRL